MYVSEKLKKIKIKNNKKYNEFREHMSKNKDNLYKKSEIIDILPITNSENDEKDTFFLTQTYDDEKKNEKKKYENLIEYEAKKLTPLVGLSAGEKEMKILNKKFGKKLRMPPPPPEKNNILPPPQQSSFSSIPPQNNNFSSWKEHFKIIKNENKNSKNVNSIKLKSELLGKISNNIYDYKISANQRY
eukprot:GHVL01007365.1.p1 GENE.GHVL01007365.1~~GHVL01007365.1.p1  ORF type:complete len:207 (+),score=95.41 GHVL01007365.1:62-622(+)